MRALIAAIVTAGVVALGAQVEKPIPREPMLQKTTVGSELYRFYCSNCHGMDAKGRPPTPSMRTASTNLTLLSMNHGGVFPREAVRDVIMTGSGAGGAHGTSDMPVWGTIFRAFEPNDTMVGVRVDNLVRYLESIQASGIGTGQAH